MLHSFPRRQQRGRSMKSTRGLGLTVKCRKRLTTSRSTRMPDCAGPVGTGDGGRPRRGPPRAPHRCLSGEDARAPGGPGAGWPHPGTWGGTWLTGRPAPPRPGSPSRPRPRGAAPVHGAPAAPPRLTGRGGGGRHRLPRGDSLRQAPSRRGSGMGWQAGPPRPAPSTPWRAGLCRLMPALRAARAPATAATGDPRGTALREQGRYKVEY